MTDSRLVIGVDPGISGAIAFGLYEKNKDGVMDIQLLNTECFPTKKTGIKNRREIDFNELDFRVDYSIFCVNGGRDADIIIEKVNAMPGQGVSSTFSFGMSYGIIIGILSRYGKINFVTPQKWKKYFGLSKDKDKSRSLASEIFHDNKDDWKLKKHDGRAEAALLTKYFIENM